MEVAIVARLLAEGDMKINSSHNEQQTYSISDISRVSDIFEHFL
jgi:hypothetical protein